MNLLVDMGNSRLKAAQYVNDSLEALFIEAYEGRAPIDCLGDYLGKQEHLSELTLVSVLGEAFHQSVTEYCQRHNIALNWAASSKQAHGVKNHYRQPDTLGSDRFVALVGARTLFPDQHCIVIDCGTAVTVDALTAAGVFSGGMIIPGLQLWGDSLIKKAGQLNTIRLEHPAVFAKDTAQAIGSGSLYGLVGAIEGLCQRMQHQFESEAGTEVVVTRLLCGGDAATVAEHSQLSFEVIPQLVLMGLTTFSEP